MLKYQVHSGTLTRQKTPMNAIIDDDGNVSCGTASDSQASSSYNGSLPLRMRTNSVSSLNSSTSSSNDCSSTIEWGPLKVHTGDIRSETDYKTLFISTLTSAEDVIRTLLSKFRLGTRDANLFQLAMQLKTRREGNEVMNLLMLSDDARPLELQRCHPKEMSRFVLQMDVGVLVRVFDFAISLQSNYKCIVISTRTTCHEAIRLLLQISRLPVVPEQFLLILIDKRNDDEFVLPREACLASLTDENHQIHLRRFQRFNSPSVPSISSNSTSKSTSYIRRFVHRQNSIRSVVAPIVEIDLCSVQLEEQCAI